MGFSMFAGFMMGCAYGLRWLDDPDIRKENKKLRKENQFLWEKIKDLRDRISS